jgi:hypothetical protein
VTGTFRDFVFTPDDPRVAEIRGLDARQYAEHAKTDSFAGPMIEGWARLYPEPFVGISVDGTVHPEVFRIDPLEPGEEAPTEKMVGSATRLIEKLNLDQRAALSYPLGAHEWRSWANPEFLQHDTGLRLDELSPELRAAVLEVVESSLSAEGYALARTLMRINGFLGDVVDLPLLMNEFSYNFALFGDPSASEPWGWHLFGHHLALNCLVAGPRMVISPVFLGAEPDTIDEGEHQGARVFDERIGLLRRLIGSLPRDARDEAIVYRTMVDPAMPEGRIHPGDERHLGGCFQDNRVIPTEGTTVAGFDDAQRALLEQIVAEFVGFLPAGPAAARVREIASFFDETWFSWIGSWEADEPFYARIQSPVAILELDHHTGVFLTNDEPAAFHIHTVVRTPNGNDYGRVLVEWTTGSPLTELPAEDAR